MRANSAGLPTKAPIAPADIAIEAFIGKDKFADEGLNEKYKRNILYSSIYIEKIKKFKFKTHPETLSKRYE